MNDRARARCESRSKILKALAHPARLFMVEELEKGERCVRELQELVGSDMSTVSKHLAQLKNAGIVRDEKRGSQVYYTLRACCVPEFLECVENIMKENVAEQIRCMR